MGSLGSSKRLPTAAEPALRPMGAVPRGAEDTCLPPELFVAHHAALAPQQGWLLAPRGVHCPGRPCLVAEAVTQCHGAALRRHRVLLPDLQHAWTCLAVCFALVCHQKKKKQKGKNSCCGRLPAPSPAARPGCSPACWGSTQRSPERCWQPGGFSLGRKPAFCSKEGVFMGCVCMLNRSQSELCRMQNTLENLLAFGT